MIMLLNVPIQQAGGWGGMADRMVEHSSLTSSKMRRSVSPHAILLSFREP